MAIVVSADIMKIFQFSLHSAAILLICSLMGCGFQLKGTPGSLDSPSLAGTELVLISSQPRGELTTALREQLRLQGAILVDQTEEGLVLRLGEERFQQRNLTLNAQATAAEVELTMMADLLLSQGAVALIANTDARVVRQFLDDPLNVVGKTEELELLREEMRQDLAAQIIRRITHSLNKQINVDQA
jgi:LPS-assembly lipoprotein